jgi:protein-S-isoprenylcysteine O-methyltransferase Ste14
MHIIISAALFGLGFLCFAAFSWGVKGHFRRTGRIPAGTVLISVLTVAGFGWFVAHILATPLSAAWLAALLLFAGALALFFWTVKATRQTPPTLAFDTDAPAFLLRHGPYRYVRHPFYVSYLLFWIGTAIAFTGLLPWLAPAVMLAVYRIAAGREEQKFAASNFRAAYAAYRKQAGMFLPRAGFLPA